VAKKANRKTIDVTCKGAATLPLDALEEFQGSLKKRNKKDIEKIIKSILDHGFTFPFFIWNGSGHNYVLDGHGRLSALSEMRRNGYDLPLFPVVYIDAKDEAEAKIKLLQQNSHYGTMTQEGLIEFLGDIEVNMDDLALPDIKIEVDSESAEVKYKEKTELIIECTDETQAENLYMEFRDRGLKCRISTL
jgi:hypothetical protein